MESKQDEDNTSVGTLLREYRVAAQLSQEALAERAHLSARAVSDLERGVRRTPYRSTIDQLADALQLSGQEHEALLEAARRVRTLVSPSVGDADDRMDDPLLATKLSVPPARSQIVARPRLLEQLDSGLRGPFTLLAAPAGSGKTTLLSAWRAGEAGRSQPVAWVSLDEQDNDPVRLRRYVLAAVEAAGLDLGEECRELLRMSHPPAPEVVLTAFLNAINTLATDLVLILDDYHVIDAEPVHQGLAFLLDHPSPYLHLVIATRADPPVPLARLRGRGQVTELRTADLRFSREEAAEFLTEVMGLRLTGADIELLEDRTEGWITGLQLAALSLHGRPQTESSEFITAFAGSHRHVMDYLMDEVVGNLTEEVQEFLLRTAILDRFTASLCTFVVGEKMGAEAIAANQHLLESLERGNLFLVPLDTTRTWYRFHHLFADAIRHRLRSQHPEWVAPLHVRACEWFETQGLLEEAIGYALDARAFDRAAALINRAAPALRARGAWLTLESWLSQLPEQSVYAEPGLAITCSWMALEDGDLAPAERCLRATERVVEATSSDCRDRNIEGEISAARAFAATTVRDPERAISHAERALERLDPDNAVTRGMVAMALGRAYVEQHDLHAAVHILDEAHGIFRSLGNAYHGIRVMLYQSYVQRFQGRFQQAIATCRQALAWGASSPYPDLSLVHLQLADLLRETNDLDDAIVHVEEGTVLVGAAKQPDLQLFAPLVLARVRQAQGDLAGAVDSLNQAKSLAHHPEAAPYHRVVEGCEAQIRLMQADRAPAAWLDQAAASNPLGPLLDMHPLSAYAYEYGIVVPIQTLIAKARLTGDSVPIAAAVEELERVRRLADRVGLQWLGVKTRVLEAMAHHASGNPDCALAALQQALVLARPEQYVRLFADEGQPMAELLARVHAESAATSYLRRVEDAACREPRRLTARAS